MNKRLIELANQVQDLGPKLQRRKVHKLECSIARGEDAEALFDYYKNMLIADNKITYHVSEGGIVTKTLKDIEELFRKEIVNGRLIEDCIDQFINMIVDEEGINSLGG